MKLLATTIRGLTTAPEADDKVYFDERLPGFGLRVRKTGSHTWMIKYTFGGRVRRMALGSYPALDPGKAFDTARDLLAQVRVGRDPAAEKAAARVRAAETFGTLLPRFLEHQSADLKPRSYQEVKRHLVVHAKPLHGLAVEGIARRIISDRLAAIEKRSGPVARNRVRASLSGYFTWLAREGYIDSNPVAFTVKASENDPRERVPSDDELRTIWRALNGDQYGAILNLLMLTGARRDEIGGLRWSEIDLDQAIITLGPERTKIRKEHTIPLSKPALAILRAQPRRTDPDGTPRDHLFGKGIDRGFQDWSGSKADLDTRITKAHHGKRLKLWTLHDFRRAISTALHERFAVPPHVVEVILGHVGGHKGGVAGVYNKAIYLDERRRALERWGAHIVELVTGEPVKAEVVELRGRRR
jgi:integrase